MYIYTHVNLIIQTHIQTRHTNTTYKHIYIYGYDLNGCVRELCFSDMICHRNTHPQRNLIRSDLTHCEYIYIYIGTYTCIYTGTCTKQIYMCTKCTNSQLGLARVYSLICCVICIVFSKFRNTIKHKCILYE